jgi:acetyl-CoA carboxylase biotin carboxylase subunit
MSGFDTVLVANRGEIALRVIRACRLLGLTSVAVHSEADAGMAYLRQADRALCIGPASARDSYLDGARIISAARLLGAGAIHPGYGFLSENADFAAAVEAAGLVFIGPTSEAIRKMGDKVAAKAAMIAAGVPVVPGSAAALPDSAEAIRAEAEAAGYPVIVKAAGGGGGRGMRIVRRAADLLDAVATTRSEAGAAFANPAVYLEKFLDHPRHVEIQVLADGHGDAVWLGARDCSMQRRHQKLVEEAPPPGIDAAALAVIGAACIDACRRIGYRGAGTFEFLFQDGEFFFIEMNTRVQVEHPVTEMVTGIDIVAEQIRIALGHPLSVAQADIVERGHAIECRLNAEDPETFLPAPGIVSRWHPPGGPGIRVDSHLEAGIAVSPFYDSLVAKIIAHGADRAEALARMRAALDEVDTGSLVTNAGLHRRLMSEPGFVAGGRDIHHLEGLIANGWEGGDGA